MMRQRILPQSAKNAVSAAVLESLNLCPDDDFNIDSDSDYASDYQLVLA